MTRCVLFHSPPQIPAVRVGRPDDKEIPVGQRVLSLALTILGSAEALEAPSPHALCKSSAPLALLTPHGRE